MSNEIKTWWERLGCIRDSGANTVAEVARDAEIAELRAALASREAAAPQGEVEDPIVVPRGLIGAACSAIDKERDAPETLKELRRYTTGDLSRAALAQPPAPAAPVVELSDAQIDEIFSAQEAKYGQLCDSEDMRMFARAILAAQQPKE